MLKLEIYFVLFGTLFYTEALECWTCISNRGISHCDTTGYYQQCLPEQGSCETMVWRNSGNYHVIKQCKQRNSCLNNQLQNGMLSGTTSQCNTDQTNSMCTCCCHSDRCNVGPLSCLLETTCKPQYELPHGYVSCTAANHLGSECSFKCTDPLYDIYPAGSISNTCLENGNWSGPAPCCTRPCPPFFLADVVTLYHASNQHSYEHMVRIAYLTAAQIIIGADAIKFAGFYFSGRPNPDSVVHFNAYNDDKTTMQALFVQRLIMNNTDDGEVNIGATLDFARTNMFNLSNGMRENVPKLLLVITDANSTDDVLESANRLRAEGVLTYAIGLAEGGKMLNLDMLMAIAGEEDHLFNPEHDIDEVGEELVEEFVQHFCTNPCQHALHNHEHFNS